MDKDQRRAYRYAKWMMIFSSLHNYCAAMYGLYRTMVEDDYWFTPEDIQSQMIAEVEAMLEGGSAEIELVLEDDDDPE
jgi:hypothetical protein